MVRRVRSLHTANPFSPMKQTFIMVVHLRDGRAVLFLPAAAKNAAEIQGNICQLFRHGLRDCIMGSYSD